MRLTDFDALTFDCYGTLIDWEAGIAEHLTGWTDRHGLSVDRERLLETFARFETQEEQEHPTDPYRQILRRVHYDLASHFELPPSEDEATAFAGSVGDWPAFSDTPEALGRLAGCYRLVVVSNVDHESFARTQARLGVTLDAVVTAEDVGAYKPDQRMFERAFEVLAGMGVERSRILHVAQSLFHDHVPAKKLGLTTVWVNRRAGARGWGATRRPETPVVPDLEVTTLSELADRMERDRLATTGNGDTN